MNRIPEGRAKTKVLACAAGMVLLAAGLSPSAQSFSRADAQKTLAAIQAMRDAEGRPRPAVPRTVVLSESELNAYFAYRIEKERADVLRELRLKLLDENRVEGMIGLDLSRKPIGTIFNPDVDFFFAGTLRLQGTRVRFEVRTLYLGYQQVPSVLLDLALLIASQIAKDKPVGLAQWYELPYGIQSVRVEAGRLVFQY